MKIDFDVMADFVVDCSVDHDVFNSRRKQERREIKEKELKELDVPQTQIQIVEV